MSIGALRCNKPGCDGFVLYEDADYNYKEATQNHSYVLDDNLVCDTCGRKFKAIISHAFVYEDEETLDTEELESACITEYDRKRKGKLEAGEAEKNKKCKNCKNEAMYGELCSDCYADSLQYQIYTGLETVEQLEKALKDNDEKHEELLNKWADAIDKEVEKHKTGGPARTEYGKAKREGYMDGLIMAIAILNRIEKREKEKRRI